VIGQLLWGFKSGALVSNSVGIRIPKDESDNFVFTPADPSLDKRSLTDIFCSSRWFPKLQGNALVDMSPRLPHLVLLGVVTRMSLVRNGPRFKFKFRTCLIWKRF